MNENNRLDTSPEEILKDSNMTKVKTEESLFVIYDEIKKYSGWLDKRPSVYNDREKNYDET